jgi:hypothetical protein
MPKVTDVPHNPGVSAMEKSKKTITTYASIMDLSQFMNSDGTLQFGAAATEQVESLKAEMRPYLWRASQYLNGPLKTMLDVTTALDGAFDNLMVAKSIMLLTRKDFDDRPEVAEVYNKMDAGK